jgi:hypothetical protein
MGFLLPKVPSQNTSSGKLDDRTVTDSAYGKTRSLAFGTCRLPSNVIWANEIEEQKSVETTSSGGKGGGGSKSTNTTYEYFLDLAVAFSEGEAIDLIRLWADGKLIYDSVSPDFIQETDMVFRFYSGREDQEPDPLIQSIEGFNTPAFRGTCYIVFERFPLSNYGNRIPGITAEIDFSSSQTGTVTRTVYDVSSVFDGSMIIDYERDRIYSMSKIGSANDIFVNAFTLSSKQFLRSFDLFGSSPTRLDSLDLATGNILINDLYNNDYILNPFTGSIVNTFVRFAILRNNGWREHGVVLSATKGLSECKVYVQSTNDYIIEFDIGYDGFPVDDIWHGGTFSLPVTINREDLSKCYTGFSSTTSISIYEVSLSPFSAVTYVGNEMTFPSDGNKSALTRRLIREILPADLGFTAFTASSWVLWHDSSSNSILISFVADGSSYVAKISIVDGTIEWITNVAVTANRSSGFSNDRLTGRWLVYQNLTKIVRINIVTGELDLKFPSTDVYTNLGDSLQSWDERTNTLYGKPDTTDDTELYEFKLGGSGGGKVAVSEIVSSICLSSGLLETEFDVSQLTSLEVHGYLVDDVNDGGSSLSPLSEMFKFDPMERDAKIYFELRENKSSVASFSTDQVISASGEAYTETSIQDSELPVSMSITFIDVTADHQQNTFEAKRIRNPIQSTRSSNSLDLTIPAVLDPTEAKKAVERNLFSTWLERDSVKLSLSQEFMRLDVGDVVSFTKADQEVFNGLIKKISLGRDFMSVLEIDRFSSSVYTSTAEADTSSPKRQLPKSKASTTPIFLDVPLLKDTSASSTGSKGYWAASIYNMTSTWPGAELYKSTDSGVSYNYSSEMHRACSWGFLESAIAPADDSNLWKFTDSYFDISVVYGHDHFESSTDLGVLNGANAIAIISNDGRVEVIQFRDIEVISTAVIRLSRLLRGRRGTDTMADLGHSVGSRFVLLEIGTVEEITNTIEVLGSEFFFKSVTIGTVIEDAVLKKFTYTGRDLKPYAPVHLAAIAVATDIDISWVRRTRLIGGLMDGTGDVPLSEISELYDLEIYDALGTTLLRTVSDLTSESYTYLEADILADGLNLEPVLNLMVYQKSGLIGRGFSRLTEVEIA